MLERTTASIKAGAKSLSTKCAQKQTAPRSKRVLHQTFWTHGAGDIDVHAGLPPYVLCTASPPADLPLQHDSRPSRRLELTCQSQLPPNGPFLDILYLPQALAWLNRVSGQHTELWEKRNARRLPEGFVQAARGYASKSYPRLARDESTKGDGFDGDQGFLEDLDDSNNEHGAALSAESPLRLVSKITGKKRRQSIHSDSSESGDRQEQAISSSFAESPGELAEEQSADLDTNGQLSNTPTATAKSQMDSAAADEPLVRLQKLRWIIASNAGNLGTTQVRAAWTQYLSLAHYDKDDIRLKEKLLSWFVEAGSDLAAAHCVTLYWSIPSEERSLQVYLTTANAFMQQNMFDASLALHEEALHNIHNGQMLSLKLFELALDGAHWDVAVDIVNQHHEASLAQGRANQQEIFWIKVLEMPQLLHKAVGFSQYVASPQTNRPRSAYVPVCQRLVGEVLRNSLQDLVPKAFVEKRQLLWDLLAFFRHYSKDGGKLYEELLVHRLQILDTYVEDFEARRKDSWSHSIISFLYYYYRKTKGAQLPEHSLLTLLRHAHRRSQLFEDRFGRRNVSVETVIEDWIKWHGRISLSGLHSLTAYYATQGLVDKVAEWRTYMSDQYPAYENWKDSMWTSIYVHARRSDALSAAKAFEAVDQDAKKHNGSPDSKCWNVLIYAQAQANNVDAAFSTFKRRIQSIGDPNKYSFQPLISMMARRGDVEAVEDLLQQYHDMTGGQGHDVFAQELVGVLCKTGQTAKAEEALRKALLRRREGNTALRFSHCFDQLLARYAAMRDIDATLRTYRWMKAERVRLTVGIYSHLMQALVNFRQTNAAWSILRNVMRQDGFTPTAKHFTIIMAGFNRQGEYQKALRVHEFMVNTNIRPSIATRKEHITTKALIEKHARIKTGVERRAPLEKALQELQQMAMSISGRDLATKARDTGDAASVQDLFAEMMWKHGPQNCLDEVKRLFQQAREASQDQTNSSWPTIQVSTGLLNALYHESEFEQVEALWKIIKDQADLLAASTPVPDFRTPGALAQISNHGSLAEPASQHKYALNAPIIEPAFVSADNRAEIGFAADSPPAKHLVPASSNAELLPAKDPNYLGPRPSLGLSHILITPFRVVMRTLFAQKRTLDMVREFTRLIKQGYAFSNVAWNEYIAFLCQSGPPFALLAFTLTERYLIARFPGWVSIASAKCKKVYKSDIRTGTQYMRTRYLPRGALMVQYRTMVWLAKAMMDVRRFDAVGMGNVPPDVKRFVGNMRLIRQKAPRTLVALKDMPKVYDKIQDEVLRGSAPRVRKDDEWRSLDVSGEQMDFEKAVGGEQDNVSGDGNGAADDPRERQGEVEGYKPFGTGNELQGESTST